MDTLYVSTTVFSGHDLSYIRYFSPSAPIVWTGAKILLVMVAGGAFLGKSGRDGMGWDGMGAHR
jgi:hypothetical protein